MGYRHTDIQTYRHTDIQTGRLTDRQTGRNTYRRRVGKNTADRAMIMGDPL